MPPHHVGWAPLGIIVGESEVNIKPLKSLFGLRKKRFLFPALHYLITLWSKSVGALCKLLWAELLNPSSSRAALIGSEEKIDAERNSQQQSWLRSESEDAGFWDWPKVGWEGCVMSRLITYSSSLFISRLPLLGLPNLPLNGAPYRVVTAWTSGGIVTVLEHSQWPWLNNILNQQETLCCVFKELFFSI